MRAAAALLGLGGCAPVASWPRAVSTPSAVELAANCVAPAVALRSLTGVYAGRGLGAAAEHGPTCRRATPLTVLAAESADRAAREFDVRSDDATAAPRCGDERAVQVVVASVGGALFVRVPLGQGGPYECWLAATGASPRWTVRPEQRCLEGAGTSLSALAVHAGSIRRDADDNLLIEFEAARVHASDAGESGRARETYRFEVRRTTDGAPADERGMTDYVPY